MSRLEWVALLLVAGVGAASCSGGDSGLTCRSGDFYLDGRAFTSCDQCSSSDCSFEANVSEVCSYPNGVQQCTVESGTVKAHCGDQAATLTISNGVASCAGTAGVPAGGTSGGSGPGTGGTGGAADPFASCTFPASASSQVAGPPPTSGNAADLTGAALGDVAFAPDTMRRTVPVTVQTAPAGIQAGPAYLTSLDGSETAYLTIPVMNSGASDRCFLEADPLQYLSPAGAVLGDPTTSSFVGGSVGDVGGGLYTDTCLAPGEVGYIIDIQISSGEPFFSGTASIQLALSSSSAGVAATGHLVPQRYDIGSCSGGRAVRVTGLNDGTLPVEVGRGGLTLGPAIFLDGDALPSGWTYLENRQDETVAPSHSTSFFADLAFDPAVVRARFFLDFDAPSATLELPDGPVGAAWAGEQQRVRNRRLDLAGRWRAAIGRAGGASRVPSLTRDNPLARLDRPLNQLGVSRSGSAESGAP